jgi:hypothetical protein
MEVLIGDAPPTDNTFPVITKPAPKEIFVTENGPALFADPNS